MNNFDRQISVVIPVYNAEKYLKSSVMSVLNQKWQKIDIVLVDDGSRDESSKICDDLARENNRISVIHQDNRGVSAARNTGIQYIFQKYFDDLERRYIAFLDADDAWVDDFFAPDTLSELPDADLICFQSLECNCTMSRCGELNQMNQGICTGGDETVHLCLKQHFGACLYKSYFLQKFNIEFVEKLEYAEDVLFFKKSIRMAEQVALCNRIFYLYRNNPISAVHRRKTGIDYFEPIFAAYLANDCDGEGVVSWYLVDMIEEHFRHFGTIAELEKWLAIHEDYVLLARTYGGDRANSLFLALEQHPMNYVFKSYILGAIYKSVKMIKCFPVISELVEKIRFPHSLEWVLSGQTCKKRK